MDRKRLAMEVDSLPTFKRPKLGLEQYVTPGDVVATIVWDAYMRGLIVGKRVADLGCGTGRFSYAVRLLGGIPICVELDPDALLTVKDIDVVICDVANICVRGVDLVVMNPPFGVWRRGADVRFLDAALRISDVVYTIHKSSTLDYIMRRVGMAGAEAHVLDRVHIPLPPIYRHHRKRVHRVEAVVLRIEKRDVGGGQNKYPGSV